MEQAKTILDRRGDFTSSQIYKLMTNGRAKDSYGKPFYDYVDEKAMEIAIDRSLNVETKANSLDWGNLCEPIAFDELSLKYSLVSKSRLSHDTLSWSGIPDIVTDDRVGDIKCPWTLKSFMQMASINTSDELKAMKPEYYWQLVSNAALHGVNIAELILFMPKESRLDDIMKRAQDTNGTIRYKAKHELPYLPDHCQIKEVVALEFEVPQEDIDALTARIEEAGNLKNVVFNDKYYHLCKQD